MADIPLDIVSSPYRDLITPLNEYLENVDKQWQNDTIIVVVPQLVPTKFWHHFLHGQTAMQIRWALEHRENIEILDVPYHLHENHILLKT